MNADLFLIALIWLGGTGLRVYRQARFYQIEEYMSGRYLRWLMARRDHWLPGRPLAAGLMGALLSLLTVETPIGALPVLITAVSSLIGAWPPDEAEVKKPFRPTARAKRMLAAALVIPVVILGLGQFAVNVNTASPFSPALIVLVGLLILLATPLWLITGNLLMTPVEALFRRRFIARARRVLAEVQPVVIGVTGSYGKTSAKTYLAHILNGRFRAYPTPKSYNTLMGICLAINNDIAADRSIEYFICEMGAYVPGEIERICELTHPVISLVVEVGPQHLERFGTLENVARAKYEIVKALPPDGVAIFNWDNPYVRTMYEQGYPQSRLAVSRETNPAQVPPGGPRFVATNVSESLAGLTFDVTDVEANQTVHFATPLLGMHNVTNILLATAAAVHEGMSLRDVARRALSLQPAESRLMRLTSPEGITIINDAYSANPAGAVHALRTLSLHQSGQRVLITPGMVELGPLQESENRKLGEIAAEYATDVLLVGSRQTRPIQEGLRAVGFPEDRVLVVETLAESVEWYRRNLKPGDTVLFLNDLPDTYSS